MKTLEQLRARHAEIVERSEEINEEFRDQELPETEQTEWDALDTEREQIETSIARIEKRAERMKDQAEEGRAVDTGDTRKPATRSKKSQPEDLHDLSEIRKNSFSGDDFVQRCKDNAKRVAETLAVPRSFKADASRERLMELLEDKDTAEGDFAKRVLQTSSPLYERAFGKTLLMQSTIGLSYEEGRALAVGVTTTGGFAVPAQLDPTVILTDSLGVSPIRELARVEQITGNKWQGITSAGVTVSRDAEAEEVSDDSPTLAQPEVSPSRVQGFVPFSYEIDQDWNGMRGEVVRMLARAKTKEENVAFLTGNATPPQPQGLLTGATTTIAAATADTFAAADVYALENALPAEFREGAVFLANKTTFNRVRQFDTQGGAQMWERIGAGQPNELLGYPVYEASGMSTDITTLAAKIMLFGNVYEAFLIVDRIGMSVELIPHLFGANRRPTGQRGIFAIWRNGSVVLQPNAVRVLTAV